MGDGQNADANSVRSFFNGSNVLITGGTGFLGMALIEKLLRTMPDLGTVFLILRPKREKKAADRVLELVKDPVFERVIKERGSEVFSRLKAMEGNVSEEGLGLSSVDRRTLVEQVHIVFHSAATLDFETPLKETVKTNLQGTQRVVELCKEMQHVKALVHVSSAYVNSNRKQAEEVLYPVTETADRLIDLTFKLTDEALDDITPKLLGDLPNPYALTKALAEYEVDRAGSSFPAAIVRPSMITGAWKEPVPGWTISKNGPTGFLMGAAKGVVRRLPVSSDLIYDYIPVDIVVNELIVAAWHVGTTKPEKVPILHCTSSTSNPFRWASVEHKINSYLHRYPLKSAVWYPHLKLLPTLLMFRISAIFVHFIPAYILDTVTWLGGGKPILVRLHTNVSRSLVRLAPFIFNEWRFDNRCTLELHKRMSEADRETFNLDISSLHWDNYFIDLAQGVRRYLNKEKPNSLPAARRKDKILLLLHLLLQILIFSLVWWLAASALGSTMTRSGWIPLGAYFLFSFL